MTCPYIEELMKQKEFDLVELSKHVDVCPECQRIVYEVMADMFDALTQEGRE